MAPSRQAPLEGDATVGARNALPRSIGESAFYNIGEACRILQIPQHTLRYWESRFAVLRPTRLAGGHRRYARRDLETALRIKDLLHNKKMTVAGARKALAAERRGGRLPAAAAGGMPANALKLLRELREDLRKLASDLSP